MLPKKKKNSASIIIIIIIIKLIPMQLTSWTKIGLQCNLLF